MRYQRIHVLGGPGSGKTYLSPSVWLRDWRVVKRSAIHLLGKSHAAKKEIFASLLNLIHWNHTYEKNQLVPARALLSRLHKNPVECRTLAQVFAVLADIPPGGQIIPSPISIEYANTALLRCVMGTLEGR